MVGNSTSERGPLTEAVGKQVRVMQIISLALVMGVCTFAFVALSQGANKFAAGANQPAGGPAAQPAPPALGTMSFLAVGMLVVFGTIAATLPRFIVNARLAKFASEQRQGNVPSGAEGQAKFLAVLLQTYQTQHVLRAALVEGPAFFGLFAYMIEGHFAVLMVPAVSIAILLTSLPTARKVTGWIEQQLANAM